ncbi:nucleoside deaminase [Thermopolyspora sp. NPDC052614]|uniref:nucleoside deaminase n=1 Tax=Thermopolyspora sp. NPDC052614 TaxID=3155682 RepID=UPI0034135A06
MDLPAVWEWVIDEAWASYAAGGWGVGAVAMRTDGTVLAAAGNRSRGLPDDVFAHAELLTLAKLPVIARSGCVIVTSLEPCVLCLGALAYLRVPSVRFGARDLSFSAARQALAKAPILRSRVPAYAGPRLDAIGLLCRLIPLVAQLETGLGSGPLGLERYVTPRLLAYAQEAVQTGLLHTHRDKPRGWAVPLRDIEENGRRLTDEIIAAEARLHRLGLS